MMICTKFRLLAFSCLTMHAPLPPCLRAFFSRASNVCVHAQPAQPVPEDMLGAGELIEIVADMYAEMRAAPGVGLAAPQIGINLQVRSWPSCVRFANAKPAPGTRILQRQPSMIPTRALQK